MKKSKIIYDIREKLKINSDDIDITNEYISHLINVKRALLIKQRYGKFSKTIPESLKQTLCLEVEKESIENSCFSNILKTKISIPDFIETYNRNSLLDIRLFNMTSLPVNIINYQRIPYLGYNKWTKNLIYGVYQNGILYLYSNKTGFGLLENIKITGIFSDPDKADSLNCESKENCDYLDKEYNISSPMVSDLVNMVVKELSITIKLEEDKLNNSDESPR